MKRYALIRTDRLVVVDDDGVNDFKDQAIDAYLCGDFAPDDDDLSAEFLMETDEIGRRKEAA